MSTFSKENTQEILEDIKRNLSQGVQDRHHSFHTPVFSNTNDQNTIESRVVVLRQFDAKNMVLNFHTDFRSPKVANLRRNQKSSFVFYDYKLKIQLRIKTDSTINNQNPITKEMWNKTKLYSRKCYLTDKAPSSITNIPEDGIDKSLQGKEPSVEESEKGFKYFTVVENKIKEIDWLYLDANGHRRLKISINENIDNYEWLIP